MCFNTWMVALHFTETAALPADTHSAGNTHTHTLAEMIKWHQMTGQHGYLTLWNFADTTQRLLNPGGPLMKHSWRQRDFPFNLRMMRWSRCLRFIHDLRTASTMATPRRLLFAKFNTELPNTGRARRIWVNQNFFQRHLTNGFSQWTHLAGK